MSDITIIYLTANLLPQKWLDYSLGVLKQETEGFPVLSFSFVPIDFGTNYLQEEYSYLNIYRQLLRGAKLATTPYIGVAEDDVLYSRKHFTECRPKDAVAFDMNRWSFFSWGEPIFSKRNRYGNFAMVAPRDLVISVLEERFARFGDTWPVVGEIGRPIVDQRFGMVVPATTFSASIPIVNVSHTYGLADIDRRKHKRHADTRVALLPKWGRAEDLKKLFV